MYWPETGRFISPAGIHPENPQSWNRYAYVWNNPYRYVDPTGMDVAITINRDTYTTSTVRSPLAGPKT
jgi:hypothetical protein